MRRLPRASVAARATVRPPRPHACPHPRTARALGRRPDRGGGRPGPGRRAGRARAVRPGAGAGGGGGAVSSELPPGAGVLRSVLPARNRIIAALGAMTVVAEAGQYSGALVTARLAAALDRPRGAVPGRVGSPQAEGTNGLLAAGA